MHTGMQLVASQQHCAGRLSAAGDLIRSASSAQSSTVLSAFDSRKGGAVAVRNNVIVWSFLHLIGGVQTP